MRNWKTKIIFPNYKHEHPQTGFPFLPKIKNFIYFFVRNCAKCTKNNHKFVIYGVDTVALKCYNF